MMLVSDLLTQQAIKNPERCAIVGRTGSYSYGELNIISNKVMSWLRHTEVQERQRVLILGLNGIEWVAAIYGVLKAGSIFVPIHPDTPAKKLEYLLGDCQPVAMVVDTALLAQHKEFFAYFSGPILLTGEHNEFSRMRPQTFAWGELDNYADTVPVDAVTPTDVATIIYTSGTTKNPKGVVSHHHHVIFATTAINSVLKNEASDVLLCGLPLSFDYGLYQIFLCCQAGAALVLEPNFDLPQTIPQLLKTHRITGFPGVPSLFALLLRSRLLERVQLPDLRYITSTGDVFPPPHIDRLHELLPNVAIFSMYGLTECKRVSILPPEQLDAHRGSVGRPLPGTYVAVIDEDRSEHERGIGELVVRGPHVMAGYWNAPDETAKRFMSDPVTGEVTLYTSDRFRIDDQGYLYFIGRDAMIIKRRGRRISVAEIESFLCSLEGIVEAAVIGLPDPLEGEVIRAFVSVLDGTLVTSDYLRECCERELISEACPEEITVLTTHLPKTANGKIDRSALFRSLIGTISSHD